MCVFVEISVKKKKINENERKISKWRVSEVWKVVKNMNGGSSSLEMQIDNFLEHFKRSASKAMDGDWALSSSCSSQRSRHNSNSLDPDYSGEWNLSFQFEDSWNIDLSHILKSF